jgi:uncharacterized protein YacL
MTKELKVKSEDDELAIKPVNKIVDGLFGLFFGLLVARLAYELYIDQNLIPLFAFAFITVLIGVTICNYTSFRICTWISNARKGDNIPLDCCNPMKSKLNQQKAVDQSWQLFIHFCMTIYEIYLIQGTTWWSDPKSVFWPCPNVCIYLTNY